MESWEFPRERALTQGKRDHPHPAASCPITKQERVSALHAVPSQRLWSSVVATSI